MIVRSAMVLPDRTSLAIIKRRFVPPLGNHWGDIDDAGPPDRRAPAVAVG